MTDYRCRSCSGTDVEVFLSLGATPLADALVRPGADPAAAPRYPLDLAFCTECSLVQITEQIDPERLFVDDYHYFSSYSDDLLTHSREHAERLVQERRLGAGSRVVEIASNDGYLLQALLGRGIDVLGIDPSPGPAAAARNRGVPTVERFFGLELARELVDEGGLADVVVANNVMAHVPDLNGFVAGLAHLVGDRGIVTVENPWVHELIERRAFDTVYHEHLCYFSCTAVDRLVRRHGLRLLDIQYFPDLHGGTLRWTIARCGDPAPSVAQFLALEHDVGADRADYYANFSRDVAELCEKLLDLLWQLKLSGARIAAYGAAAKGATLLNVVGIGTDLIDFVVDRNPHKQGLLMPGVGAPIRPVEALLSERPDYVLLLAWNFVDEIRRQQANYVQRGGRLIVPVPTPTVLS